MICIFIWKPLLFNIACYAWRFDIIFLLTLLKSVLSRCFYDWQKIYVKLATECWLTNFTLIFQLCELIVFNVLINVIVIS